VHPDGHAVADVRPVSDRVRFHGEHRIRSVRDHDVTASSHLYGRTDWPEDQDPLFTGYSIGRWIDQDGDGKYDVLEVETRNMKVPRIYDQSGIPFHEDGQGVITERIYLDKADPNILHNEMTTTDHALTRPWTVVRNYRREKKVFWAENNCVEGNDNIAVGTQDYLLSSDGYLMPAKKDQPPPDLRYFKQTQK
jgi:hypothetical protein